MADWEKKLDDAAEKLTASVEAKELAERDAVERLTDLKQRHEQEEAARQEAATAQLYGELQGLFGLISPSLGRFVQSIQAVQQSLGNLFGGKDDSQEAAQKEMARAQRDAAEKLQKLGQDVRDASHALDALKKSAQDATMGPVRGGDPRAAATGGNPIVGGKGGMPGLPGVGGAGGEAGAAGEAAEAGMAGGPELAAAAGVVAGFAGAVMAAVGAVQEVIGKLRPFVEAISPTTIEMFDVAMRNLQATIGSAFTGVFESLTATIRQVSGIIEPLFDALKPVVDQFMETITAQAIPVVKMMASMMESLLPLFKILVMLLDMTYAVMRPVIMAFQMIAMELGLFFGILEAVMSPMMEMMQVFDGIMDSMQQMFDVLSIVIKSVIQTIVQFIQSLMPGLGAGKMLDALQSATRKVIEAYVWFIATIYKALGLTNLLANLAENLRPKHGKVAAITNTSFKSVEQISKDMALASAKAAGGVGAQKSQEDMMADMSKLVEDIASGKSTSGLGEKLGDAVRVLEQIRDFLDPSKAKERVRESFVGQASKKLGGISPAAMLLNKLLGG